MENSAAILILLFFAITYIQSSYEKISDWEENIKWLRDHFAETFLKKHITISLVIIVILEFFSTALCITGIIELYIHSDSHFALYAAITSAVTLLVMLFGQRVAKDYEGARTIAIYFVPAVIAVYLLQ